MAHLCARASSPVSAFHPRRGAPDPIRWTLPDTRLGLSGGRRWWAHLQFMPVNTAPLILSNQIEDLRGVRACVSVRVEHRGAGQPVH